MDRKIGDYQCLWLRPGDSFKVMQDVGELDVGGVRKTEDYHAQRIADEQYVRARFVQQPRRGIIVAGERGDGHGTLAGGDGGDFFLGCHELVR